MANTNFQTIHQMGNAITNVMKQAMGRDNVQNIDMDFVTVAQRKRLVEEIITGNPVTFFTNIEGPLDYLIAQINPVQDLHGFDAPWPGGAGKNILPMTVEKLKAINTSGTWSGNAYESNGITYTVNTDSDNNITGVLVNGTSSAESALILHKSGYTAIENTNGLILNGCPSGGSSSTYMLQAKTVSDGWYEDYGDGVTISSGSNSSIEYVRINVRSGETVSNAVYYPMIRLASVSDATYAPYSNICPISGWDSVQITRTGKNLLKNDLVTTTRNNVTFTKNDDGTVVVEGTASAATSVYILGSAGNTYKGFLTGSYIISKGNTNHRVQLIISMYNGTTWKKQIAVALEDNVEFEIDYDGYDGVAVSLYVPNGNNVNETVMPMIRYASETDNSYAPYESNVYSITWEDSAGTVYGGTVTINEDGSGKLIDNLCDVDLGSLSWTYDSSARRFSAPWSVTPKDQTGRKTYCISSCYECLWHGETYDSNWDGKAYINGVNINIHDHRYSDATTFASVVSGQKFVYEVATPVEIDLTELEVIETLNGVNTIWADTGNVTVSYKNYEEVI